MAAYWDPKLEKMMENLASQIAQMQDQLSRDPGRNHVNNRVSLEQYYEALRLYEELGRKQELARLEQAKLELEQQAEAARAQTARADVMVRALEVAAQSGITGQQLLSAIEDFGEKLMSGESKAPVLLALEDKRSS